MSTCRKILVHFAHARSWSWSAVPDLIHAAEKASCGFVNWTWDHAFWVSRLVRPCTNSAGAVCSPMQMCKGMLNLEFHYTDELRWWLLHMRNPPPLVLRWVLVSPYGFPEFQNLPLIFPLFLVYFRYLSPRQLVTFFRFITAGTVQSIIIISICLFLGMQGFVTGNLMSLLDSTMLIISPLWNILNILTLTSVMV